MAKRSFRFPWRIFFYVLYLGGGIAGIVLLLGNISVKSNELACREMQIHILGEENFVEFKDIAQLIDEEFGQLVGRTLASIPLQEMEEELANIPYVSRSRVSMDMNGQLNVEIWQRKAVIRIIDENGRSFYVDQERVKLPVSSSYAPQVPLANGFIPERYQMPLDSVESDLVHGLFNLAIYLSNDAVWSEQIVQIYVNEAGDIELIPKVGQHRIILGDAEDLSEKFTKLMVLYQGVVPKTGLEAYEIVNLKYKDQLVCVQASGINRQDSLVNISSNIINIQ